MWDDSSHELIDDLQGPCSITLILKTRANGIMWMLTNVYGPAENGKKEPLWEELWDTRCIWNLP